MIVKRSVGVQIRSVQTGRAQPLVVNERTVLSAIRKTPVAGPVSVGLLGLAGDEQVDLAVHGGLEKALYAYPEEHYSFWDHLREQAGVAAVTAQLPWGSMGENLTLAGLLETQVWVGDRLAFPDCELRVTQPREPCFKFNLALGFNKAVKCMAQSGFCGFYLAVDRVGTLRAGESFELHPGPRRISIPERFSAKMYKHLR